VSGNDTEDYSGRTAIVEDVTLGTMRVKAGDLLAAHGSQIAQGNSVTLTPSNYSSIDRQHVMNDEESSGTLEVHADQDDDGNVEKIDELEPGGSNNYGEYEIELHAVDGDVTPNAFVEGVA
jgi:hypothetical protein